MDSGITNLSGESVEDLSDILHSTCTDILDSIAPLRTVRAVPSPSNLTSTNSTSNDTTSNDELAAQNMILMIGAVITVDVVLLLLPLVLHQSKTEKCGFKRQKGNITDEWKSVADYNDTFSIITYKCNTE